MMVFKKLRYNLLLFFVGLSACLPEQDEPIPEGAALYPPLLVATYQDGQIGLEWGRPVVFCNMFCPDYVEPSRFVLYQIDPETGESAKLVTLANTIRNYVLENLENGQYYQYQIVGERAETEMNSNIVMAIPNPSNEVEVLYEDENPSSLRGAVISPDGKSLAFLKYHTWEFENESGHSISLLAMAQTNFGTYDGVKLIKPNAGNPVYSSDGLKLMYDSYFSLEEIDYHDRPSYIEIYHLEDQHYSPVIENNHKNIMPVFNETEQAIYYLSNNKEGFVYGIWKYEEKSEGVEALLTDFGVSGNLIASGKALNYGALDGLLAFTNSDQENHFDGYKIDALDILNGSERISLVKSAWNDAVPSFSPFEKGKMAFLSDRSGVYEVWILNWTTGIYTQVTSFKDVNMNPAWSNISWTDNGESLVVNRGNSIYKIKLKR